MNLILVLHNIRSTYNVGAILRSADGFGVEKTIFSGYTPRVHDKNLLPHLREKLDAQISKTALGAEDSVEIENSENILETLSSLKRSGYEIVGLENNISDARLMDLKDLPKKLGNKVVLVLGEEVDGIATDLYPKIDYFAEIPMRGTKESFNVSVAAGIALYALLA